MLCHEELSPRAVCHLWQLCLSLRVGAGPWSAPPLPGSVSCGPGKGAKRSMSRPPPAPPILLGSHRHSPRGSHLCQHEPHRQCNRQKQPGQIVIPAYQHCVTWNRLSNKERYILLPGWLCFSSGHWKEGLEPPRRCQRRAVWKRDPEHLED